MHNHKANPKEKGNILFVILICIGLFAALTYTISRSNNSTSYSNDGPEYASAQEILSFAEMVANTVNRLQMQNGCRLSEISFKNSIVDGYTNLKSPSDGHCDVFGNNGGGITYFKPTSKILDDTKSSNSMYGEYLFTGSVCLDNVGSGSFISCNGDDTENEELLIILPWVKETSCDTINRILKNPEILEDTGASFSEIKFKGTFSEGSAIGTAGHVTFRNGCFKSNTTPGNGYHLYYTLIAK